MGLFFTLSFFISTLRASELGLPSPAGAVKVLEKSANFGPIKSFTKVYKTSLAPDRVLSFYKKEMVNVGWKQEREGVFIKDNYLAVIVCNPAKNKTRGIEFSVTTSNIPAKEEILAMRKTRPDKLIFMPVYPGSVQVFLWDLPTGVTGSYETESSVKEVVFFYKSGMLNYGWSLDNEAPVKAGATSTASRASLLFRRINGETCAIMISNISAGLSNLPAKSEPDNRNSLKSPGKTTISVHYNAHKNIRP